MGGASLLSRASVSLRWRARRATSPWRTLPDFLIIGAARAGTTGLHRSLCSHPDVIPPFGKEPHFFGQLYDRGTDWYRSHFPAVVCPTRMQRLLRDGADRPLVTGEATPSYLADPRVPERVRSELPRVRLLVVLREPVDRAHSHWRLRQGEDREERTFEEVVGPALERGGIDLTWNRRTPYLSWGVYVRHLERWLALFPRRQMHVVVSEELWRDPWEQHRRILEFLELRDDPLHVEPMSNHSGGPPLDPGLRGRLEELFAPHNAALGDLLGRDAIW